MGRGRSLQPLSPPQVGGNRVRARTLLLEMIERNHTQAPNPVSCSRGRGRGLSSPSPPHPDSRARIRALPPQPAPNALSLGRARSRAPGPSQIPEIPLHLTNMVPKCLCPKRNFPDPHIQLPDETTLSNHLGTPPPHTNLFPLTPSSILLRRPCQLP